MYVKKFVISSLLATLLAGASSIVLARDLVMGLIPAEDNEEMVKTFEPMRAYLEDKLGQKVKVFTATDYAGVIEGMKKKRVDIAWFGPLSYYLAEMEAGAEPFAVGIREGTSSPSYKGIFVASCGNGIRSIDDLKGKNVAFVDPASTSGGLVPSYMVKKATGKMPQDFFGKFIYAGSHDASMLAVKNKTVYAGASNDVTYQKMLGKGLISTDTNCVIAESDPIPGSPLVYRGDLTSELKLKIQGAILNAHNEIEVTGYGKLSHYVAASPEDYQIVRDMVKELGLKKDQLK